MPPDPRSLSALAARAQLGDHAALEALLRTLSPGLRNHLSFLLHESSDVDDALQETLWIFVRRLGSLRDAPLVRAWAYRIATREALRLVRRSKRHRVEELTEADAIATPEPDDDNAAFESHPRLLEFLDRLPAKARVVVGLRYVDGLSQQEIAEALEIPIGTVKSRLAYGLNQLRALLGSPDRSAASARGE